MVHRRTALWLAGATQAMIAVDSTIMNVALPAMQHDLAFADGARHWVVTAFALAFGGLLLPASRMAATIGTRRALLWGGAAFGAASALGALAWSFELVLVARAMQGVAAALLAPAALAMLQEAFPSGPARRRAFGVYGAVGVAGTAAGLLVGGPLTQLLSWRATLLLLVLLAGIVIAGAARLPRRRVRSARSIPVLGTGLSAGGLLLLVLSMSLWDGDDQVLAAVLAILAAAVLWGFARAQRREDDPLVSAALLSDRTRLAALGALGVASSGLFSVFLFVVYFLQDALDMGPIETSLAMVPFPVVATVASVVLGPFLARTIGPRLALGLAAVLGAAGMGWLAAGSTDPSTVGTLLPAIVATATGMGVIFAIAPEAATAGLDARDRDAGASLVHVVQQVGGAIGIAVLALVASSRAAGSAEGYQLVFGATAAIFLLAGALGVGVASPRGPRAAASETLETSR